MKDKENRLISFFSILTESEQKRFPIWLENELEKQDVKMWKWFECIWIERNIESAWDKLFKGESLNRSSVSKWNNRILEKLELFLAIEAFKEEAFLPKLYLNRFSLRRSPKNCFHDTIRKSRRQMQKQDIRDHSYYEIQHELDRLELEYSIRYPNNPIRRHQINQAELDNNYKLYLLLQQMEILLNQIGRGRFNPGKKELLLIEELESLNPGPDLAVAHLFLKLYKAYTFSGLLSKSLSQELFDAYCIAFKHLRPDAQYSHFLNVYNCFIRAQLKSQAQSSYHIEMLLQLCDFFYGKRKDIHMRSISYSNHTKIYLRLAEASKSEDERADFLAAVEEMQEKAKPQLEAAEREDVYLYNRAMLLFARSKFEELERLAIFLYRKGGFSMQDIHQELSFDHLYAKSLYELGKGEEELLALLKRIINKTNTSKRLKESEKKVYAGRAKFFKQMLHAKNMKKAQELLLKLESYSPWLDKNWFEIKLREKADP